MASTAADDFTSLGQPTGNPLMQPTPLDFDGAEMVVDVDNDGEILRTYSLEELRLREKVHALLTKFDSAGLGVMTVAEAQRTLLQLGIKPPDVTHLVVPVTDDETELIMDFEGGEQRLSKHSRRNERNMLDIGVLTERVACLVEGVPVLARQHGKDPLAQVVSDGEDAATPEPARRKSVEDIVDKYESVSAENVRAIGLVKSILDARLFNISSTWRRQLCDNGVRRAWDIVILISLSIYFVAGTVYNIKLYESEPMSWWIVFLLFHVLWGLDLALNSVCAARNTKTGKFTLVVSEIVWSRRYVIAIDLISVIPLDLILWWFAHHSQAHYGVFLAARAFKCVKLAKIGLLFEIVNNDVLSGSDVTFFFQIAPIVKRCGLAINVIHVLVLVFNWSHEVYRTYLEALMFTLSMVFGAGPSVLWDTHADYAVVMALIILSVFVRGIIIGQIHVLLFEGDVESQNLVVMQDTLALLRHYDCPDDLQQDILSFQRHLVSDDISHHLSVLKMLPRAMQDEVQTCMKTAALTSIPFLHAVGSDVRIDIATCMERHHAEPGEMLVQLHDTQTKAYVIAHGSVDILGPTNALVRTVDAPGFFGETSLLGLKNAPARYSAKAVSYADLWVIQRHSFTRLLLTHIDLVMSIEEYFGVEHPFMANLEALLHDFCGDLAKGAESVIRGEEARLARTSSSQSMTSIRGATGAAAASVVEQPGPISVTAPTGGATQASNSTAVVVESGPTLLREPSQTRMASFASVAFETSMLGANSMSDGNSRKPSSLPTTAGIQPSPAPPPGAGHTAVLMSKKQSVATKFLNAYKSIQSQQQQQQTMASTSMSKAPAEVTKEPGVTAGGAVAVDVARPVSPSSEVTPSLHHTSSGGKSSGSGKWGGMLRTVASAPRAVVRDALEKAESEGRPPSVSTDGDPVSTMPSGAPTPRGATTAPTTADAFMTAQEHQQHHVGGGGGGTGVVTDGQSLVSRMSSQSSMAGAAPIKRYASAAFAAGRGGGTVVDDDTASTASSAPRAAISSATDAWVVSLEARLQSATSEIRDLVATVKALQGALRDVLGSEAPPAGATAVGNAARAVMGADQWYADDPTVIVVSAAPQSPSIGPSDPSTSIRKHASTEDQEQPAEQKTAAAAPLDAEQPPGLAHNGTMLLMEPLNHDHAAGSVHSQFAALMDDRHIGPPSVTNSEPTSRKHSTDSCKPPVTKRSTLVYPKERSQRISDSDEDAQPALVTSTGGSDDGKSGSVPNLQLASPMTTTRDGRSAVVATASPPRLLAPLDQQPQAQPSVITPPSSRKATAIWGASETTTLQTATSRNPATAAGAGAQESAPTQRLVPVTSPPQLTSPPSAATSKPERGTHRAGKRTASRDAKKAAATPKGTDDAWID